MSKFWLTKTARFKKEAGFTNAKHLLDIWKLYGECLRDDQFLLHKRRFRHVWGWGEEAAAWGLAHKNGTLVTTN
jgi:hypothetical protein